MPAQRRESRSSACTICRQPAAPGSNLCAPCRSAFKRARDSTVSEAILPLRRQRKRPATTPATPAAESAPQGASAHRWVRGAWAVALGGVLVAGGAWIVHTRGNAGTIAPRYAVAAPESEAETIKAAATTAASTVSTAPAERAAVAAPGVDPPRAVSMPAASRPRSRSPASRAASRCRGATPAGPGRGITERRRRPRRRRRSSSRRRPRRVPRRPTAGSASPTRSRVARRTTWSRARCARNRCGSSIATGSGDASPRAPRVASASTATSASRACRRLGVDQRAAWCRRSTLRNPSQARRRPMK